jgi:type IV secretory pathway TrbF-like protein
MATDRYQEARSVYADRIEPAVQAARRWRLMALIAGATALIAVAMAWRFAERVIIKIRIVEVHDSGRVRVVEGGDPSALTLSQNQVRYFVSQWIQSVREYPTDPTVVAQRWHVLRAQVTERGLQSIADWTAELKAYDGEQRAVQVRDLRVSQLSRRSWEATWIERHHDRYGRLRSTRRMWGRLTLAEQRLAPSDPRWLDNPIGVLVDEFASEMKETTRHD